MNTVGLQFLLIWLSSVTLSWRLSSCKFSTSWLVLQNVPVLSHFSMLLMQIYLTAGCLLVHISYAKNTSLAHRSAAKVAQVKRVDCVTFSNCWFRTCCTTLTTKNQHAPQTGKCWAAGERKILCVNYWPSSNTFTTLSTSASIRVGAKWKG